MVTRKSNLLAFIWLHKTKQRNPIITHMSSKVNVKTPTGITGYGFVYMYKWEILPFTKTLFVLNFLFSLVFCHFTLYKECTVTVLCVLFCHIEYNLETRKCD